MAQISLFDKIKQLAPFMQCETKNDVIAVVSSLIKSNKEKEKRIKELESKTAQQIVKLSDSLLLSDAINNGYISEDMRSTYESVLDTNRQAGRSIILSMYGFNPIKKIDNE